MDRRTFLQAGAGLASAAVLTKTSFAGTLNANKLKILVLGGRDYFGPTLIDFLIKSGHDVTHFNRGFTNPHLFKELTWVKGNREIADGSGLELLRAHLKQHTFDLVIDTWQKLPSAVHESAKLLKPYIGQYQYVSSISAYKDKETKGIDENYPMYDLSDTKLEDRRMSYSAAKAWSETALYDELGDKAITFRSHGMRSNRLPDRIYEPYWPARMLDGGKVLLPKDDNHVMQVCDVVSMVHFMHHAAQEKLSGIYNVALKTTPFEEYINRVDNVTKQPHQKVWVPKAFLKEQGIEPYRDLPLWRPQLPGFYHINTDKAIKAGFKGRSIEAMVTDQLQGYLSRNPKKDFMFGVRGRISRQKEKSVLTAWENKT